MYNYGLDYRELGEHFFVLTFLNTIVFDIEKSSVNDRDEWGGKYQ